MTVLLLNFFQNFCKMLVHNSVIVDEAYQEKPRPDLYNIVKKVRDMKTSHTRLLYIAEVKDKVTKAHLEEFFMEFQSKYEMTGLLLILNNYYIHLME